MRSPMSQLDLQIRPAAPEDWETIAAFNLKLAEETLQRQDPEVLWKPVG